MVFMRRRPLMRAAVVGGGAYVAGRRAAQRSAEPAGQDERYSEPEPQAASSQPASTGAAPSIPDQLSQLTTMRQQGSLTESEFAAAKAQLLGT